MCSSNSKPWNDSLIFHLLLQDAVLEDDCLVGGVVAERDGDPLERELEKLRGDTYMKSASAPGGGRGLVAMRMK